MDKIDFNNVLDFMKQKHGSQKRRSGEPYTDHLIETGDIAVKILHLVSVKYPLLLDDLDNVRATGLLHDAIEDTGADYEDIYKITNQTVASWVAALSIDKRYPFLIRRDLYNKTLETSCLQVKIVKLADIYSNLNGIRGNEGTRFIVNFSNKCSEQLKVLNRDLNSNEYFTSCNKMIMEFLDAYKKE